ncbi:L-lactate dehydrogenase [Coniochaeta sp. 2T2.1]|nr:L-lactate dehydrogenase [Coniochaeta sp. 2T2.1]
MDVREVANHNSQESCWLILFDKVYDVTEFVSQHPGGPALILKYAGADATKEYSNVHSPAVVEEHLPLAKCLGEVDAATKQYLLVSQQRSPSVLPSETSRVPPLSLCVRLEDFEPVAKAVVTPQSYVYISSAADTLQSHRDNIAQWSKITFIPRVLRDVSRIDTSSSIFGQRCSLPFFIAATGMAGLTHPEGESPLAIGAALSGIHYSPSTYTSVPHEIIATQHREAKQQHSDSCLIWQLYVNKSRDKTRELIRKAKDLGFKGLFITVDTPVVGKRDEDKRLRAQEQLELGIVPEPVTYRGGEKIVPGSDNGAMCRSLNWEDVKYIREAWQGPIALKGIQSAEDAKLAMDAGIEVIYLSNHGGRQLHSAPSALATLLRIQAKYPEVLERCEIILDGGVTRGGDIVKALCLGAKAVGVGRPLLYAMGAYGLDGVMKAIDILRQEVEVTMTLLGATRLEELTPSLVNVRNLAREIDGLEDSGVSSRL